MPWSSSPSTYMWTRTTLFRALQDTGFCFIGGPNHYDVARDKPSKLSHRDSFLGSTKDYWESGRATHYIDKTWAEENLPVYRSWTDGTRRTRVSVPQGKSERLNVVHVRSRKTALVQDAAPVISRKKARGTTVKRCAPT